MTHKEWMDNLQLKYNRSKIGYTQLLWDILKNKRNFIITVLAFETKTYHDLIYTLATR